MAAKTDSTTPRSVSPWYEKGLKIERSTQPPKGFDVRTKRPDITRENFLEAVDNSSVPQEALMCYANFVYDSIRRKEGEKAWLIPLLELKRVGESLIRLIYGTTKPSKRYQPFYIRRRVKQKHLQTQAILESIFDADPTDQCHLRYIATATNLPNEKEQLNASMAKLRSIVVNQPGVLQEVLSGTPDLRERLIDYCVQVMGLYKKPFDTPFLFKVTGTPAFLIDLTEFFDDNYLPTMETLNQMFRDKVKLRGQNTYKKELFSVTNLVKKGVLGSTGNNETFAQDLVRFFYEILHDDTVIGRKNQVIERVEEINPYLLRTRMTTQQKPHLDSPMGALPELGLTEEDTPQAGKTRRSGRAMKTKPNYKESDDDDWTESNTDRITVLDNSSPTSTTVEITEEDHSTRTYLPWSFDIPLIKDPFYLNLWLIDHKSAVNFMKRNKRSKTTTPLVWQIGIRLQIPSKFAFLWRNDLVHSGCYAGPDKKTKPSNDDDAVHVGVGKSTKRPPVPNRISTEEPSVSNCERMHAYLPTSEQWLTDLETRTPSTFGYLNVFTPFDGTLASSKKRHEEHERNQAVPDLASYLYWYNGDPPNKILTTGKKLPENYRDMLSRAAKSGK